MITITLILRQKHLNNYVLLGFDVSDDEIDVKAKVHQHKRGKLACMKEKTQSS